MFFKKKKLSTICDYEGSKLFPQLIYTLLPAPRLKHKTFYSLFTESLKISFRKLV